MQNIVVLHVVMSVDITQNVLHWKITTFTLSLEGISRSESFYPTGVSDLFLDSWWGEANSNTYNELQRTATNLI